MKRLTLQPRADWREKADAVGFIWHHTDGQPYWDESTAYSFTLREIEDDLEPAAANVHELCLDLVDDVLRDEALLTRLAIPEEQWSYVVAAWSGREPTLYGRFDFAYDGSGPPKLYEYNADTPTSVYEAATFQWLWLEDRLQSGDLPPGTDQFNSLYDKLRQRFAASSRRRLRSFSASDGGLGRGSQTVRIFEGSRRSGRSGSLSSSACATSAWTATAASSSRGFVLQAAFKLYPWGTCPRGP
jgi:glutathionylspermidine synthase